MSAVCKFYLSGYCKFGDRCRYRHVFNADENYYYDEQNYNKHRQQNSKAFSGVSVLRSSSNQSFSNSSNASEHSNFGNNVHHNSPYHYNSNNQRAAISSQNISEVLGVTLKEIELLENGHQWPLTCFCPLKETSIAPGWIDHSPEELRWEIYKASKDGTFENCKLSIQGLYKEAQERRNEFSYRDKGLAIIESMLQNKKDGNLFPSNATANTNNFKQENSAATIKNVFNTFSTVPQPAIPFESAFANAPQHNMPLQQGQDASRAFYDPAPGFSFSLNPNSADVTVSNTVPPTPFPSALQSENNFQNNSVGFNGSSISSSQITADSSIFSLSSDLTETELSHFRENNFKFGQVPLKPPPKELCPN